MKTLLDEIVIWMRLFLYESVFCRSRFPRLEVVEVAEVGAHEKNVRVRLHVLCGALSALLSQRNRNCLLSSPLRSREEKP